MPKPYTLTEVVARIESTTISAQKVLHNLMLEMLYREKRTFVGVIGNNTEVEALEKAGLVFRVDEPEIVLRSIHAVNKKFLYERLITMGYTDRKKNQDHVAFCLEHLDLFEPITQDACAVALVPEFERVRKKVYIYLGRKLFDESYYDVDTDMYVDFPKGASFVTVLRPFGEDSGLQCKFPDDEITELLDKYGCNRCRTWRKPE